MRRGLLKFVGWTAFTALIAPGLISGAACAAADPFTAEERAHWAFQPVARPAIPSVRNSDRVRTPIDSFVLSRLESQGRSFSPDADRRDLVRRATFDLIGLPPSPEDVDEFLADERPDAYERLVDRLLDSPQYGESQARMWLDLVRFADTAGYNADPLRPLAWQYRDWVIRAFNEDRTFARFVEEQIAGDELFPDDRQARIATGYLRMWPDESNASNVLLARQDALNDLTGNVAAAFLGLSLACAQCHDHKFDPLPQRDFYTLQAFFAGISPAERGELGTAGEIAEYRRKHREWLDRTESVRRDLAALEASARVPLTAEKRMRFPAVVLEAIDTPPERRSAFQRQLAFWSERQIDYKEADLLKKLDAAQQARRAELQAEMKRLRAAAPKPPREVAALTIAESAEDLPPTFLLSTGSYDQPEDRVEPGFLTVLVAPDATSAATAVPTAGGASGRRSALARWLVDPANPLAARVMVNRLWQERFGEGFVENASDFGVRTPRPADHGLLDWLAAELVGIADPTPTSPPASFKRIHRLIVTSTVYRQATRRDSTTGPASESTDEPLAHFPRRRLSAEKVRDALLAVSGDLNPAMGGPGVCPPLPKGYNSREAWTVSADRRDHVRRSVYVLAKRNLPYPLLHAFDLPDMHESCACRSRTTTAPQALMLLNGDLVRSASARLAERVRDRVGSDDPAELARRAWTVAIGRSPTVDEERAAIGFLERQRRLSQEERDAPPPRKSPTDGGAEPTDRPAVAETGREPFDASLADLCHVLLNLNEFLYLE